MPNQLGHRLFFVLIVTLAWSAAMGVEANGIAPAEPEQIPADCYFSGKPILDVELAQSPECFTAVATKGAAADKVAHNIKLLRVNTGMDFLFIVLYWSSFVVFARVEDGRLSKWLIGSISLSALFDVLENTRILKGLTAIAGPTPLEALLPRPFSVAKWGSL